MSIVQQIRRSINTLPEGKPFMSASLYALGKPDTVRKVLGRLVLNNELKRLARGVFITSINNTQIAQQLSTQAIVQSIAEQKGEVFATHGAEAARKLSISTQIPLQLVLYTTGKSRVLTVRNRKVILQHVSPRKLVAPGTLANDVISALWYLGKNNASVKTLAIIRKRIGQREFNNVLQYINKLPAWMADLFYHYQKISHHT